MRPTGLRVEWGRSLLVVVLAGLAGLGAWTSLSIAQERAATLVKIGLEPTADGVTGIIDADGKIEHRIYVVDDPMQVVVDVLDVRNSLDAVIPPDDHPLLRHVLSHQLSMTAYEPSAKGRTFARVTFVLKQPVWHSLRLEAGRLMIGLHPTRQRGASSTFAEPVTEPMLEPESELRPVPETEPEPQPEPELTAEREPDIALTLDPVSTGTNGSSLSDVSPSPADEDPRSRWIEPADVSPDVFFGLDVGPSEYVLGADDLIEIRVFELEQLNRTVRVEADGSVILPLIGPVRVGGLTAPRAAEAVASALRGEYIDDPQVTLLITEHQSRRVSLLGAVARPGAYPLLGTRGLLEVVASAGGLAEGAGTLLYVFRRLPDGRNARLSIPLQELLVLGDPKWNIGLRSGDVVSIPPENAISVSVVGSVGRPGVYKLPAGNGATLLRAIALAGGLAPRASKDIQVKRPSPTGDETVVKVDLGDIMSGKTPDYVLREGDVVIVNQSFF